MNRGQDPRVVFQSILSTGKSLRDTTGQGFYADVQEVQVSDQVILHCFQLPCGGNIFLLSTEDETVLIDTGYGNYYPNIGEMLVTFGLPDPAQISRIIITHGDADHAGGAGNYCGDCMDASGNVESDREGKPGIWIPRRILYPGSGIHETHQCILLIQDTTNCGAIQCKSNGKTRNISGSLSFHSRGR